jgi:hypothetical protein
MWLLDRQLRGGVSLPVGVGYVEGWTTTWANPSREVSTVPSRGELANHISGWGLGASINFLCVRPIGLDINLDSIWKKHVTQSWGFSLVDGLTLEFGFDYTWPVEDFPYVPAREPLASMNPNPDGWESILNSEWPHLWYGKEDIPRDWVGF